MNVRRSFLVCALASSVLAFGCADEGALDDGTPTGPIAKIAAPASERAAQGSTPFQQSLRQRFEKRQSLGLPVPTASYDYLSDADRTAVPTSGQVQTVVATTTIHFDHPQQAGLDRWPPLVVEGDIPSDAEGVIRAGDYTDAYRQLIDSESPGFWRTHEFGLEPRTYTITETFTATYPGDEDMQSPLLEDVVMGNSFPGPGIDYTVSADGCVGGVCAFRFEAGFALDWAFGIRLPMSISIDTVDPVQEGDTFVPISGAQGVDWSAADYTDAGILPEDGNEFLMRFQFLLGVFVEIAGSDVINVGPNIDIDRSSTFVTPFGPGAVFSLPTIDLPIYERSLAAVELTIGAAVTPQAGSDRCTADWASAEDGTGAGGLIYTDPSLFEDLASVFAVDGPGVAGLTIDGFKYVFNQFLIQLGAYIEVDIFGLYDNRFQVPLTDFDLSSIVPDISVPVHPGSDPTSIIRNIAIENVAPTAVIDLSGTDVVNGTPTIFSEEGTPVELSGASYDPGRDDLTVEWDFGDGDPSPDTSTLYPLAAPTGPNAVSETQSKAFTDACLYHVELVVTDSDGASNIDHVAVFIRDASRHPARLAGYWQSELQRRGRLRYTDEEIACLLNMVEFMSTVFDEVRTASDVVAAFDVMLLAGNRGDALEKLDRELLVAWLNFSIHAFDLAEMVDTDQDMVEDSSFADALAEAEMVRLDPLATMAEIDAARQMVHYVCTQGVGEGSTKTTMASGSN